LLWTVRGVLVGLRPGRHMPKEVLEQVLAPQPGKIIVVKESLHFFGDA
jgi:hypothetical protein